MAVMVLFIVTAMVMVMVIVVDMDMVPDMGIVMDVDMVVDMGLDEIQSAQEPGGPLDELAQDPLKTGVLVL